MSTLLREGGREGRRGLEAEGEDGWWARGRGDRSLDFARWEAWGCGLRMGALGLQIRTPEALVLTQDADCLQVAFSKAKEIPKIFAVTWKKKKIVSLLHLPF